MVALGAASLFANACNSPGPSAGQLRTDEAGQAATVAPKGTTPGTTPGLFLRVDLFPYALVNDTFPVIVSFRNSAGQLMNVADNITIKLSTTPTAAPLLGASTKAPTSGVARFDVSIAKPGQGFGITASSTQAGTATSALFNVAYSQDVGAAGSTPATAPVISPKVPLFSSIAPGDVQYYKFFATLGQQLSVSTYANRIDNSNYDTSMRVRLVAPDGSTELVRAAATTPDSPGVDNGISLVSIPKDGDYYLACDVDQAGYMSGTYAMLMTLAVNPGISLQTEAEAPGATDKNDTIATAQKLSAGTLYGHYDTTATGAATSDFYAITVVNPVQVRLDLNAARSGAAVGDRTWIGHLELQDAAGNVLAANEKSYGLDPAIDYVITKAATYYVRVTGSSDPASGLNSPYYLNYQSTLYTPATESTTNTTSAGAMTLSYNSDVSGTFSAAATHWFAFGGTAGDIVRVLVQDRSVLQGATLGTTSTAPASPAVPVSAPQAAVYVRILQADGVTEVPTGYSLIDTTQTALVYRQTILQATGTYFVRVQSNASGKFGLRLERVATTVREVEPNDTAATANAAGSTAPIWMSGVITSGDQDHFKVHGEAGQLLTVSVLGPPGAVLGSPLSDWGSSLVPSLEIRDSAGNLLSATSADRKGGANYAETLQHPLLAQINNIAPAVQASFRALAAGDFDIALFDAGGQGGPNYFYALNVWKNQ